MSAGRAIRVPAGAWLPILFLVGWEAASHAYGQPLTYLPSLEKILRAAVALTSDGTLQTDLFWTLSRVLQGFVYGATAGTLFGCAIGASKTIDCLLGPVFHALRQVPFTGLVPLVALFFGVGETAQIGLVTVAAFCPGALNTADGLHGIPAAYRELGRSLNFNGRQMWLRILIPGALPQIMTGLKHGIAFSWIAAIAAELLITTGPGLGALIESGTSQYGFEVAVVGIFLIGALGYGMSHAMFLLDAHLLDKRRMK